MGLGVGADPQGSESSAVGTMGEAAAPPAVGGECRAPQCCSHWALVVPGWARCLLQVRVWYLSAARPLPGTPKPQPHSEAPAPASPGPPACSQHSECAERESQCGERAQSQGFCQGHLSFGLNLKNHASDWERTVLFGFFSFLDSWPVVKKKVFYSTGNNTTSLYWMRQEAPVNPKTYEPGNSGELSQISAIGANTHARATLDTEPFQSH